MDAAHTSSKAEWPPSRFRKHGRRTSSSWTLRCPDCDGFTVAEAMRGTTRFSSVPIVAHTSLPEDEVIDKGKAVETDAFYRKGAPLHGLFRMIEHLAPSRRN
jgi:CheY-like chemotaxis protein